MASDNTYRYLTFWTLVLVVVTVAAQDFNVEDSVKDLIARRKNLDFIRQLVEDMDNQLITLQKRTCHYNGGMSHSCEYKGLAKNTDEEINWLMPTGPGKRKRSSDGDAKKDMRTFFRSMKALAGNRKRR